MKSKFLDYFLKVVEHTAELSHATRLKVGAIVVKDNRIISCGYNGLPSGSDDTQMEYIVSISKDRWSELPYDERSRYEYLDGSNTLTGLKTSDEVIHAESNCISRLASSHESGKDSVMICTHSCCIQCAKIIYGAGISKFYYKHEYRSTVGLEFLTKYGVEVIKC